MTGFRRGILGAVLALAVALPARVEAHDLPWLAQAILGDTGFVDEATDHFLAIGGAARRQVTPRISVGPEFVAIRGEGGPRDLSMMLTGSTARSRAQSGARTAVNSSPVSSRADSREPSNQAPSGEDASTTFTTSRSTRRLGFRTTAIPACTRSAGWSRG